MAKGGRGNDRIVNTTMHWFFKNPEKMKDTFVKCGMDYRIQVGLP